MPPDPQRKDRLQAKINFPISGKRGFFLLLANTLKYTLLLSYVVLSGLEFRRRLSAVDALLLGHCALVIS
jgi:hypothetical protein